MQAGFCLAGTVNPAVYNFHLIQINLFMKLSIEQQLKQQLASFKCKDQTKLVVSLTEGSSTLNRRSIS